MTILASVSKRLRRDRLVEAQTSCITALNSILDARFEETRRLRKVLIEAHHDPDICLTPAWQDRVAELVAPEMSVEEFLGAER